MYLQSKKSRSAAIQMKAELLGANFPWCYSSIGYEKDEHNKNTINSLLADTSFITWTTN